MRSFLALLVAIALTFPGKAETCTPFTNMRDHVLSNFAQAQYEQREGLPSLAESFPGADRCLSRKASDGDPVARMQCYWSRDVENRFTVLLQDLKSCYPGWQEQERTEPSALRQVILKQDEMRAGVWLVQLYKANTRVILMLVYMQKVKP